MKKLVTSGSLVVITSFLPFAAEAQTLQRILVMISDVMGMLIPMALSAALIAFFWGLAKFIWNSGSAETRQQGMSIMISGVAALFVMVSIWGLVARIAEVFCRYLLMMGEMLARNLPTILPVSERFLLGHLRVAVALAGETSFFLGCSLATPFFIL
jgi:hypothetical protein